MSILIKGVEMPKKSWECPCHNGEYCNVTQKVCYEVPKDCPLVEVSTPHGDLVDIDEEVERHKNIPILGVHLKVMSENFRVVIESEE